MVTTMKIYHMLLVFLLATASLLAAEGKKTVCVNMIVKNESKVITRCLSSLKPLIDYWVIVDTGSTDGTQEIIKSFMKDIPGELHEDPFVNFEYSRNKALDFAKGKADYILIIDADEVFVFDENFKLPKLDKDFYYITTDFNGTEYGRVQLINNHLNWRWKGVLHEALDCPNATNCETLAGIKNLVRTDGARSTDPQKYHKDAKVLETALKEDPTNTRYMFYLAQSYKDAGEHAKALEWYQKRVDQGGWDQEVFQAMLEVASMQQELGMSPDVFAPSFLKAYHYRPVRAEPLYQLANYYRTKEDYVSGYLIASIAYTIPTSKDVLFVRKWMYDYGIPLELSICAYWIGKYEESRNISLKILEKENIPESVRECVERNLSFANKKIIELYQNNILINKKAA